MPCALLHTAHTESREAGIQTRACLWGRQPLAFHAQVQHAGRSWFDRGDATWQLCTTPWAFMKKLARGFEGEEGFGSEMGVRDRAILLRQ